MFIIPRKVFGVASLALITSVMSSQGIAGDISQEVIDARTGLKCPSIMARQR